MPSKQNRGCARPFASGRTTKKPIGTCSAVCRHSPTGNKKLRRNRNAGIRSARSWTGSPVCCENIWPPIPMTRIWHAKPESCFWILARISGAFFGCIAPWKSIRDTLSAIKRSRPITNEPTRRARQSSDRKGAVGASAPLRSRLGLQLLLEPFLALRQVRRCEATDYIKGALGLGLLAFLEEKSHLRLPAGEVKRVQSQQLLTAFPPFLHLTRPNQQLHETNLIIR